MYYLKCIRKHDIGIYLNQLIFSFLEGGCGGVQDWKNRHSSQQSCLDVQYAGTWHVEGSKRLTRKYIMIEKNRVLFDEYWPQIITNAILLYDRLDNIIRRDFSIQISFASSIDISSFCNDFQGYPPCSRNNQIHYTKYTIFQFAFFNLCNQIPQKSAVIAPIMEGIF